MDAREHQIKELRTAAEALRKAVHKARSEAAGWQTKADQAHERADRNEETARVWEVLADALDRGQLDDIVVPLGTGPDDRPTNTRIHALQGRLMAELPDLDAWNIHLGELAAMLHKAAGGSRRTILGIAERYGIGYVEDRRGEQIYVAAEGEIDDIPVKLWCLLPADDEQRDDAEQAGREIDQAVESTGHLPGYADANRTVEHVDYAEAEAVREIHEEMALEAAGVERWEDL